MNELLTSVPMFGLTVSLLVYWFFLTLQKRVNTPLLNPTFFASVAIIIFLMVFHVDLETYDQTASVLNLLIGPATVSLAIPLYRQIRLLKENWLAVLMAVLAGSLTSMGGVLLLCKLLQVPQELYWSMLPKSTTTAIGMAMAQELGGLEAVAAAAISFTGVTGAMLARTLAKVFRITDPVAQGLALGTASHVIGTSAGATELGEIQGAMGSLAIVTAGIITVIAAPLLAPLL
ncbi:MAG: LrgB family protein [Oscillospiraceae bacterium]|nr:LrgB family protein [Oscillospiraceae bacterium]